jgi:hypothetical protein
MKTVASDQLYLWASGEFLSGVGALYLLLCDNDDIEESERERERKYASTSDTVWSDADHH